MWTKIFCPRKTAKSGQNAGLKERKKTLPIRRLEAFFWCFREKLALQGLLNSNSDRLGHTDHGGVAGAQEAHHLDVGGDGGRTGELGVGVHTAHGIGHAIGSGTGSHVVGMQGTAGAAAGSRKT